MSETATASSIHVSDRDGVRTVTLNRPERGNSIHGTLLAELLESVESADRHSDVRAVVTTGAGWAFCVGGDLDVFARLTSTGPLDLAVTPVETIGGSTGLEPLSAEQRAADHLGTGIWVRRFLEVGTPTIAAINGATSGGGLAIALLHDIRIMARSARIHTGFAALGLSPEMGMSWLLPRMVGTSNAFRILTTSQPISAAEALNLGIVSEVVDDDDLGGVALETAQSIARTPDQTVRAVKRLLRQSWDSSLEQQLEREWSGMDRLFRSEYTRQRVVDVRAALQQRRKLTTATQDARGAKP